MNKQFTKITKISKNNYQQAELPNFNIYQFQILRIKNEIMKNLERNGFVT